MIHSFKAEEFGVDFNFDIELEKNKRIYCFIGKNGIGKTLLLENMARSLIFTHSIFDRTKEFNFSERFYQYEIRERFKSYLLKLPVHFEINDVIVKNKFHGKWGVTDFDSIASISKSITCDKPVIFVGAKNRGFSKNIDSDNIKILADIVNRFISSFERIFKYMNGEGLESQEIADWFASRLLINPVFVPVDENKTPEAVTVLKLIERLEPEIKLVHKNEDGSDTPKISFSEGKLLIGGIPLDKLSTGYVSIIKIFQEIVAGYSGWTNAQNLNEVEGIVFIDELEPHLHISWQTKIIGILRDFFPKTTFYISTHSPLVLAGLKSGEGYELFCEGDTVKAKTIDNIENYFLNDIVKEFFGVDLNKERIENIDPERQQEGRDILLNLIKNL